MLSELLDVLDLHILSIITRYVEPIVVQRLILGGNSQMVFSAIIVSWQTPLDIIDRTWTMYNTMM